MTDASLLDRAIMLLQHHRPADAEKLLRDYLAVNGNNATALSLLAQALLEQKKHEAAEAALKDAIAADPSYAFPHLLLGQLYFFTDRDKEAEEKIVQAIHLDPSDPDAFAVHAQLLLHQKKFEKALQRANEGLAISPEHLPSLNARSTALVKLGRKAEGFATVDKALERDPDNAFTHSNYGWAHLERGDHKKALEHFRNALRLNGSLPHAKAGMVEALKARYWFYRLFLQYRFWVSRMQNKYQGGFIIGLYIGYRVLLYLAESNPALSPFLMPLIILYIVFAMLTWVMEPLSNLFLRLNVYGRFALTDNEVKASNLVGVSLLVGALGGIIFFAQGAEVFAGVMVYGITMMLPLSLFYHGRTRKGKGYLRAFAIGLAVSGAGALALAFAGFPLMNNLVYVYLLALFAYQWVANYLMLR